MIEEIIKLREEGLTFRKIAEELDTTVGKVQYQWRKYHSQKKKIQEKKVKVNGEGQQLKMLPVLQNANWSRKKLVPASFLSKWFTGGEQLFPYWRLIDSRRKPLYNLKDIKRYPKAVRLFDVTYLPVAERSPYFVHEAVLERGKEALAGSLFQPSRSYMLELGIKLSNKEFCPLIRSNVVRILNRSETNAENSAK